MSQVLIVDDHADIRRLLSVSLSTEFSIQEAWDGDSAMDMVRRFHPKVVLLDVMLPGNMDGFKILRTIKSDPLTQDIKVAIVSARGQQTDQQMAEKLGADAYFIKPFSPMQVKAWIRSHIQP
jgi:CheY-like chemotaxis protein